MKLYLYCSYTHSKRGFVLTRLDGDELIPISLLGAKNVGERILDRFFSYDGFDILWQEYSEGSLPLFPSVVGGVFGIRSLKGKISDRDGVINVAFQAEKHETDKLGKLAIGILADPEGFAQTLCSCLSIGGICGYRADAQQICGLLETLPMENLSEALQQMPIVRSKPHSVRDQLRFAVYAGTWEQVAEGMSLHWIWRSRPRQVISRETFIALLGRNPWR